MAAATTPISLLPPPSPAKTRPPSSLLLRPPFGISSPLSLSTPNLSTATNCGFLTHQKPHRRNSQIWRTLAAEDAAPPPADIVAPLDAAQEIVSAGGTDDGVGTIISTLLFIAFVALSVLTVGVIYIAVTDFLQKREKEKFEKEEAAKKKRGGRGKKVKTRARAGPRGFGQKVDTEDDLADDD